MYELVIAKERECLNYKVLMKGSYDKLYKFTTQYNNSFEIRKKFPKIISAFEYEFKDSGDIVIVNPELRTLKKDNPRVKVMYKKDKEELDLFKKLINVPKKDESVYVDWLNFWRDLGNKNGHQNNLYYIDDNDPLKKQKIMQNTKLKILDDKFNNLSISFRKKLYMCSEYIYNTWYTKDTIFLEVFKQFKSILKTMSKPNNKLSLEKQDKLRNNYYSIVKNVLEAFDIYLTVKKIKGKKSNERFSNFFQSKTKEEYITVIDDNKQKLIDNIHDENHSQIYLDIYSYIITNDIDYIYNLFNNNPEYWWELFEKEKEEIKEIYDMYKNNKSKNNNFNKIK